MRIEHQIAAVSAVQCPGGQQVKVGDEGAEASHVFDSAHQGLMGRIVLVDDWRALVAAIVDNDVDLVAAEARLGHGFLDRGLNRHPLRRLHRDQKIVGVLLDVVLNRVEMLNDVGKVAIAGAQLVHHQRNRGTRGVAVELAQRFPVLALVLRHLLHDRFELALDLLKIALNAFALGRRQRLEQFGCKHLAVTPRRHRQPRRGAQHADAFLLGTPLQLAKALLVTPLELLIDDVTSCPVLVAFEGCRQGSAQFLDEPFHRLAQPIAATRRQL